MAAHDCPRLRPLHFQRVSLGGSRTGVALLDPLGIAADPVVIPGDIFSRLVRRLDGRTPLALLEAELARDADPLLTAVEVRAWIERLDRALLLDGQAFARVRADYHARTQRPAALAGLSYPENAAVLTRQLDRFYDGPSGAGRPRPLAGPRARVAIQGVLSPHIDFNRGGSTYTWAYRHLVEATDATLFVVLGVAHQATRRRFVLTRQDFATPLGVVSTDRALVDRLADRLGPQVFDDELVHRHEHSVEFQAVFLQHALGAIRPFRILPILVGSFHDLMERDTDPMTDPEVSGFVTALRDLVAEQEPGRVAFIGGIDLSHIGPEFGDAEPLDPGVMAGVRDHDLAMLDRASASDPAGWFRTAAAIGNRTRICGLAATYTMLQTMGPTRGRLLRYDQAVDPARTCGVTFASLALEAVPAHA